MKDILVFAKEILLERMPVTGTFIDFTMGNGHDTLYFAQYLEQGHVYAFDIQPQAVENTRRLRAPPGHLNPRQPQQCGQVCPRGNRCRGL